MGEDKAGNNYEEYLTSSNDFCTFIHTAKSPKGMNRGLEVHAANLCDSAVWMPTDAGQAKKIFERTKKHGNFTITKKIAKHGNQAIIVVPRVLEAHLKPGTIARITIEVIEDLEVEE